MCGIFGFASSPPENRGVSAERFFAAIDSLLEFGASAATCSLSAMTEAEQAAVVEKLRQAHAATYQWVQREGVLQVLR